MVSVDQFCTNHLRLENMHIKLIELATVKRLLKGLIVKTITLIGHPCCEGKFSIGRGTDSRDPVGSHFMLVLHG